MKRIQSSQAAGSYLGMVLYIVNNNCSVQAREVDGKVVNEDAIVLGQYTYDNPGSGVNTQGEPLHAGEWYLVS